MINDFLSDILKVVIVLDVFGVIAYFLLGLKSKAQPSPVRLATAEAKESSAESGLFGPGFLNPAVAASQSPSPSDFAPSQPGLWKRMRSRVSRKGRSLQRIPAESLELAMSRLRGVLNSYERGLSI